jgi:hypothetical protein
VIESEPVGQLYQFAFNTLDILEDGEVHLRSNEYAGGYINHLNMYRVAGPTTGITCSLDVADVSFIDFNFTSYLVTYVDDDRVVTEEGSGRDSIMPYLKRGWDADDPNGPWFGTWLGAGITSSAAAIDAANATSSGWTGIGYTYYDPIQQPFYAFHLKYTWMGDANLNGAVNMSDLSILAAHWQDDTANWGDGDFTYDYPDEGGGDSIPNVEAIDFQFVTLNQGRTAAQLLALRLAHRSLDADIW